MILVDTSVWIDHFRRGDERLTQLLLRNEIATHDFVVGELALGEGAQRSRSVGLLRALPQLSPVSAAELLHFVDRHHLGGKGIGYVDAHLLAAAVLHGVPLWTRDKRLQAIALEHSWAYPSGHLPH